jgi:hypothetical protein
MEALRPNRCLRVRREREREAVRVPNHERLHLPLGRSVEAEISLVERPRSLQVSNQKVQVVEFHAANWPPGCAAPLAGVRDGAPLL